MIGVMEPSAGQIEVSQKEKKKTSSSRNERVWETPQQDSEDGMYYNTIQVAKERGTKRIGLGISWKNSVLAER